MTNFREFSDLAILKSLGTRIKTERLNQDLTQMDVARRAGIARIVLTRLESGKGCTLGSFIRILRSLGKLDHIELFLPEPGISPLQIAKLGGQIRLEASGKRGRPRRSS